MDHLLALILDPPPSLSFGNLTRQDLLDLSVELEAFCAVDPVLSSLSRAVHAASTARARGRDVPPTFELPEVTPEEAQKSAETVRHLIATLTGRSASQSFLCELCLSLLVGQSARAGKNIRLTCVGFVPRMQLLNSLLDGED